MNDQTRKPPAAKRLSQTMEALTNIGVNDIAENNTHEDTNNSAPSTKRRVKLNPIKVATGNITDDVSSLVQQYAIKDEYLSVPIKHIRISHWADRWAGEQDYTQELGESFKTTGSQLQPSIGRLQKDDTGQHYVELLAGIMRFRTREQEGPETCLRVYLVDVDDEIAVQIIIDENRKRKVPSSYSDSLQCKKLLNSSFTRERLFEIYNVKEGTLSKMLKFAEMPIEVLSLFGGNIRNLSLRMGYELSRLAIENKKGLTKALEITDGIITGKITKPEQISEFIKVKKNNKKNNSKNLNYQSGKAKVVVTEFDTGKLVITLPHNVEKGQQEKLKEALNKIFGPPQDNKK